MSKIRITLRVFNAFKNLLSMKNLLTILLLLVLLCPVRAQTANSFSSVVPYTGPFEYGMNPGYWGNQFNNTQLGQLAFNAGAKSFRLNLADYLSGPYNGSIFNNDFVGYAADGLANNVGFVGSVWANDQLDSTFPGCSSNSYIWRGTYQPIWTDSVNAVIDTANRFANYIYQLVTNAGSSIKYWEIINEIDQTGDWVDAGSGKAFNVTQEKLDTSSWWNKPPTAAELNNFQAPIFYYIHMLKIAYQVIKRFQPNSYVTIGGIGYPATLDVLLRYTDNPVDGSVTPQFPLKGGAYFDVISFHTYPMYDLDYWNTTCSCVAYNRQSDAMIDQDTMYVHQYDSVQVAHGYNNNTYPKKIYISTETDAPQDSLCGNPVQWGSLPSAINYIIKWDVACQAFGLTQLDKYGLGSEPATNYSSEFNHTGLYGDITPATTTVANAPKTQEYYGYLTMSNLLYGKKYDPVKTAAMNIPNNIRGYAFKDGSGNYTYVLWAKTTIDLSEGASATYTFPFSFSGTRMEWNFSSTNLTTSATQTVALTGNPSFFLASAATANKPPVSNAGADQLITLPTTTITLTGSGSDSDGTVASYKWTKVSGPVAGIITTPSTAITTVTGLVAGVYKFALTVTDNLGATGTDTVQVTVNTPPVANAGLDQTITLPTNSVTLNGSATDSTGTIASYLWTKASGPTSGIITTPTSASTTVTGLAGGTYKFVLTVKDNNGISSTDTMQVTVNTPPVANAGIDQTITLPTNSITLSGSGTDANGTIISYTWTKISGPASGTITNATSVSTSVTGLTSGVYKFVLIVKDNLGATGTDTMQVTVNTSSGTNGTNPPAISSAATAGGTVGTAFSYTITASNTPTSYAASGLPAGLTVSTSTGVISGTPTSAGTSNVTISAINAGGTGTKTLAITINPVAPVISSAATAGGTVGTAFSYTITASNTPTSYAASGLPAGLTVSTSTGVISGTPTSAGTSNVTISAINAGGTGTKTLAITINPVAPVISSAATAGGTVGTAFSYTITASNTPTSYAASGLPAGLTVSASTGVISGTPTSAGTSNVTISAINAGGTGTNTLQITINTASNNKVPVANAGGHNLLTWALTSNNTVISSGPVNGNPMLPGANFPTPGAYNTNGYKCVIASGDWPTIATNGDNIDFPLLPDTDIDLTIKNITFTAQISGSSGSNLFSLAYQQDGTGSWIPFGTPQTAASGATTNIKFDALNQVLSNGHSYVIRLYVYAAGATTTSSRNVYIKNVVFTGTSAIDIVLPTNSIKLNGSGNDSDGTIASYLWTKASGPSSGTITSPASATTTVTGLAEGVYKYVLTVTDNLGAKGTDTIQVTVNAVETREAFKPISTISTTLNATIYPNPVRSTLYTSINTSATDQELAITLTDISGRTLYKTKALTTGTITTIPIDVSHLTNGVYFLNIQAGSNNITRKIIKGS